MESFSNNKGIQLIMLFSFPQYKQYNSSRFKELFEEIKSIGITTIDQIDQVIDIKNNKKLQSYEIDINKINSGEDRRTSIMIKNLPEAMDKKKVNEILVHVGNINYVYLPQQKHSNKPLGVAYVNVINYKNVINIYKKLHGTFYSEYQMTKPLEVVYSSIQGKANLTKMFYGKKHENL